MIDGLKPYAAMKDTGVPWLGEVPEHWKFLARLRGEVSKRGTIDALRSGHARSRWRNTWTTYLIA